VSFKRLFRSGWRRFLIIAVSVLFFVQAEERPLCVAVTDLWAPFNLKDEKGKLTGIGIDYWEAVAERLGVSYRYEIKSRWEDVLRSIEKRTCDLTVATQETTSRTEYARFSVPYVSYPIVIVTRMDVGFVDDIDQIADRTIALPKAYATTEKLLEEYENLHVLYTNNIDEALRAVSEGKAFATIGVLPVVAYKITRGLDNLKISGKTSQRFHIGFMVRSDRPDLVEALNRVIASFPKDKERALYDNWTLYPQKGIDYRKWSVVIFGMLMIFGILVGGYVVKLKRNVKRCENRTKRRISPLADASLGGADDECNGCD
jgi:ABC-type amino acid transport substrate-binding protein